MKRTKKKNLIRPIAPATPQPGASTNATAATNATQAPQATKTSGRPAITITPKISKLRSTSLTELIKDKEKKAIIPFDSQTEASNSTFSQADLAKYWIKYTDGLTAKKSHLKNTLINCKPTLLENASIEVAVYNPSQKEEISENNADILEYLRTKLNNSHIRMDIRIVEKEEKEMVYTATEKYAYLIKKNPNLEKLKDKFNLTLE